MLEQGPTRALRPCSALVAASTTLFVTLTLAGCNATARRDGWRADPTSSALRRCEPPARAQGRAGSRWCLPNTDGGLGANPSSLDLAVMADGRAVATWIEASAAGGQLMLATETADGGWRFESPAALLSGSSLTPRLACSDGGACGLVWAQVGDGGTLIYLSSYADGVWTNPSDRSDALSFAPHSSNPELAVGEDGEILVVWNQRYGDRIGAALARREPDGAMKRPHEGADVLSLPLFFVNDIRVARNRRGDAVISWYQSMGGPLSLFASERHGRNGAFSRPRSDDRLSPAIAGAEGAGGRFLDEPVVAIAESGAASLVWEQPIASNRVAVFEALRDAAGKWTTPATIHAAFSALPGAAWRPKALFTARGDLYVGWIQADAVGHTAAVMLAHRLPNGSWVAPGDRPVTLSTTAGRCESLEITASSDGAIVAVWSESIDGARHVFARRRSPSGEADEAARWEAPAELSGALRAEAYTPKVASGGRHGRVVVAWIQSSRVRMAAAE